MSPDRHESDSGAPDVDASSDPASRERRALSEDWLATVVGLVLLVLVPTGALPGRLGVGALMSTVDATTAEPQGDRGINPVAAFAGGIVTVLAIAFGLLGNLALTLSGTGDRLASGFRTGFFIKTGLVLLGASINLQLIVDAAGRAIIQAILLITIVFGFTWWLGGLLGIDPKLP